MPFLKLLFLLMVALGTTLSHAQNYGKYVGTVQTEWLEDGRKMRLLSPFSYFDPKGEEWHAPSNSIVDGASIPQLAWSVIGGPFEGKYRNASVIHDVGCDQKAKPWETVHEVFYWAMLASGVESWRAKVMYAAVYHLGPRWPRRVTIKGVARILPIVARRRALKQAEPGSAAEIVGIHSPGAYFFEEADFDIQLTPPPTKLTKEDFGRLERKIMMEDPESRQQLLRDYMDRIRGEMTGGIMQGIQGRGIVSGLVGIPIPPEFKEPFEEVTLDVIRTFQP